MRYTPTFVHGVLDYLMGAFVMVAPWVFGFADHQMAMGVTMACGAAVIAYSLFTNYELGVWRKLSMNTHLGLDAVGGGLLAASPWLFGFADFTWVPNLALGIVEVSASALTCAWIQADQHGFGPHGRPLHR